jgi:MFS family permease
LNNLDTYKRNIKFIYAFTFSRSFLVIIPVIIPFFLSLGFSMQQVFELQVIFGLSVAILEVPSGYLSDMWGRKKVIILGAIAIGIGFSSMYFAKTYFQFVFVQIFLGIAISMISGSDISILYDCLHKLDANRKDIQKSLANNQLAFVSAESIASLLGGALVLLSFKAVLVGQFIAGWLPLIISLFIFEPEYKKMDKDKHLDNFKMVLKHIFCSEKLLKYIFLNNVIWSLSTFTAVWVFQKYWQNVNIPLGYFGAIWAFYNIFVGIVGKQVHWLEEKYGAIPLLLALSILPILGFLSLGFSGGIFGVIMGLTFQASRGMTQIILKDALNWRIDTSFRATANSILSLMFRLSFAITGPIVGMSIDKYGVGNTMIGLASLYSIAFLFLMLPLIKLVKDIGVSDIPSGK